MFWKSNAALQGCCGTGASITLARVTGAGCRQLVPSTPHAWCSTHQAAVGAARPSLPHSKERCLPCRGAGPGDEHPPPQRESLVLSCHGN